MAKLGTAARPAVLRVRSLDKAREVLDLCEKHGLKAVVGVEPDKPEDLTDLEKLLNAAHPVKAEPKPGRNDPCPCGSGAKYKRCCGT